MLSEQFIGFQELINSQEFYDAHELMEEIWIEHGRPRPSLHLALIQLAASLEHVKRKNMNGARALALRSLKSYKSSSETPEPSIRNLLVNFEQFAAADFHGEFPTMDNQ